MIFAGLQIFAKFARKICNKVLYIKNIDMLIHQGSKTIESERLTLRAFQYTDDEDMLNYWISDPNIQSMYSEPVYVTRQEVKELLDKYISSYEKLDYYRWAIIEKQSQIVMKQKQYVFTA